MSDPTKLRVVRDRVNEDVVETLERALERARRGELLDVIVYGTCPGTNEVFCAWSHSMDTARRLGLLTIAMFDMQHAWSHPAK